jgi:uncharacterized protein with von Willebrand factor type A (vWA) domain
MSSDPDRLKVTGDSIHLSGIELERVIVEFCRCVRANGLGSGTKTTIDCLQVLRIVKDADPETLEYALRAVLCSSKEEWDLFDKLFATIREGPEPTQSSHKSGKNRFSIGGSSREQSILRLGRDIGRSDLESQPDKAASGASLIERLIKTDFALIPQTDLAELERLSLRLLRRLSRRISRKFRTTHRRGAVDLRRTIRGNLAHGGDLIELRHRRRKRQRAKLILLLDVSDSMNLYSLFLLKFAYALKKHSSAAESFIFSTKLVDINSALKARRLSEVLALLSEMTTGWSSGTRIGGSMLDFNRLYAGKLLSRETVFIILSDGWDTEDPELLGTELRKIKLRVSKLVWLNPLLGLERYEPITRGMKAALPYIDVFAPAHNLQSLLALEKHLERGWSRKKCSTSS